VKVSVRVDGAGFRHVEALLGDIRRRALERLQARFTARNAQAEAERSLQAPANMGRRSITPPRSSR
jgi:hypothetical protein